MNKKIPKILSFLTIALLLSAIAFSTSSKADPNPSPSKPCDEDISDNLDEAYIQVNFEALNKIPFRKSGKELFIPSPDLRWGNLTKDDKPHSKKDYNCVVTLSSPQCPNWVWSEKMTDKNTTSSGKMKIVMPPVGYDVTLQVVYKEIYDDPLTAGKDFNKAIDNVNSTSVVYTWEMTYLGGWGPDIPQPVFLYPTGHEKNCDDFGCVTTGKKAEIQDFGGVNAYLEENGLFGH